MLFDAEGASRVLLVFFLVWGVLDGGSSALAGVASRRGAGGTCVNRSTTSTDVHATAERMWGRTFWISGWNVHCSSSWP